MKYPRRVRWAELFTTTTGLARLCLLVMVCPAVMLAALLASIVMTLAGSLSVLGLAPRQPRAPWRVAGDTVGAVLARALGRQGFTT